MASLIETSPYCPVHICPWYGVFPDMLYSLMICGIWWTVVSGTNCEGKRAVIHMTWAYPGHICFVQTCQEHVCHHPHLDIKFLVFVVLATAQVDIKFLATLQVSFQLHHTRIHHVISRCYHVNSLCCRSGINFGNDRDIARANLRVLQEEHPSLRVTCTSVR